MGARSRFLAILSLTALAAGAVTILACDGSPRAAAPGLKARPHADSGPILVELFTSQGCSSCPPADRVLSLLRESGQVDGIPIVVLSEHVDYWNRLGWTDPYSQAIFSERQAAYARAIRNSGRVYTPQMIVDGRDEFVGHNLRRATEAVRNAAGRAHARLQLKVATVATRRLRCTVQVPDVLKRDADLLVAITEDRLSEQVTRGENAGNRLRHDGVVRRILRRSAEARSQLELELDADWQRENLRVVAWLEDRATSAVLGTVARPVE